MPASGARLHRPAGPTQDARRGTASAIAPFDGGTRHRTGSVTRVTRAPRARCRSASAGDGSRRGVGPRHRASRASAPSSARVRSSAAASASAAKGNAHRSVVPAFA